MALASPNDDLARVHWRALGEWWREFFGPDYFVMYAGAFTPSRTQEEVDCAEKALGLVRGDLVLDCGCGHGRHVRLLRERGYRAVGVDLSREQIRMTTSGRSGNKFGPPLVRGDVRRLPFSSRFDAVISMYTSFGYFSDEENERHLREMARAVKPGGRLLIDLQNPSWAARHMKPTREVGDEATGVRAVEEFHLDAASRRVISRKRLFSDGGVREYYFALRQYHADEFRGLLRRAGLCLLQMCGDYDFSPLAADSPRAIFAAQTSSNTWTH